MPAALIAVAARTVNSGNPQPFAHELICHHLLFDIQVKQVCNAFMAFT